jgi:hypothetical protein
LVFRRFCPQIKFKANQKVKKSTRNLKQHATNAKIDIKHQK